MVISRYGNGATEPSTPLCSFCLNGYRLARDRTRDRDRATRGARADPGAGRGPSPGAGAVLGDLHTEPIVGWRLWHVRIHEDAYRLESFTWHHVSWPGRERFEARCPTHGGEAPVADHECGIYAFRTRRLAEDLLRRYTGVRQHYGRRHHELPPLRRGCPIALGRVSLWGRVLGRENGFRAQYAYPYELLLIGGDDDLARELRSLYAVDVSTS